MHTNLSLRILQEIAQLIPEGSHVLDLGCAEGDLLDYLSRTKHVKGMGVDIDEAMVLRCISRGISVFQGDLDEGLKDYQTASYDYVILSRTLQVIHKPVLLLKEMVRVGKHAIVSFPNFGYAPIRLQLLFRGQMPVTPSLPYQWFNTPNIHLCTKKDFRNLCEELRISILQEIDLWNGKRIPSFTGNLCSTEVCFLLQGMASSDSKETPAQVESMVSKSSLS
ncbi:MAG TPA: methionine biosynthesis protein MetW [Spirochaetales bacterium]|nr:methionine biosynthesis protein MetW [Spirochaetales bacterium]HOV39903.1 methionine biosynthesis protein MetW [Spirochaetales bacterium]